MELQDKPRHHFHKFRGRMRAAVEAAPADVFDPPPSEKPLDDDGVNWDDLAEEIKAWRESRMAIPNPEAAKWERKDPEWEAWMERVRRERRARPMGDDEGIETDLDKVDDEADTPIVID